MDETYHPLGDQDPLHEEEQSFVVEPLDSPHGLFAVRQSIIALPNGETKTRTVHTLHVAHCNHLMSAQAGDLIGLCDLCGKWLCPVCVNRLVCMGCLRRICNDCLKLIDGNKPYCPSCWRKEHLKRFGSGLHRLLSRKF